MSAGSSRHRRASRSASSLAVRIVDVPDVDLLDIAEARGLEAEECGEPTFYWSHPALDETWLASGSAWDIVASGANRIETVAVEGRELLAAIPAFEQQDLAPRLVGGFAFSSDGGSESWWCDFPDAWFFLPRHLWVRRRGRCRRIDVVGEHAKPRPKIPVISRPPRSSESEWGWRHRVESALARIAAGELEKVVLSRRLTIPDHRHPPLLQVVRQLRNARPNCVTFAVKSHASVFLGSTPEVLARREGTRFFAPALAGTALRGDSTEARARQVDYLLHDDKLRREHQSVVEGIQDSLRSLDVRMDPPGNPSILALPEALHLFTAIEGLVVGNVDVLTLAAALHPTPAVCGLPRAKAARILRRSEPDRGWFTGGVGWMDGRGDGTIAVALRSALLSAHRAHVFAGAGIVAGSEAADELREIETKMRALLEVFAEPSPQSVPIPDPARRRA